MDSQRATQAGAGKSPGLVLTALCLASFMATLDLFVVNIALKDIGRDFAGQRLSNLSWILNAHAIIFSYVGSMLPDWVILGTGLGFAMPTVVESATVDLPPGESGTGSAINATARQLGAVLATAVTAVILGTPP